MRSARFTGCWPRRNRSEEGERQPLRPLRGHLPLHRGGKRNGLPRRLRLLAMTENGEAAREILHLIRHPPCGGRRMPPSPQGEGFLPGAGTLRALVRSKAFSGGRSWAASLSLIRPRCDAGQCPALRAPSSAGGRTGGAGGDEETQVFGKIT